MKALARACGRAAWRSVFVLRYNAKLRQARVGLADLTYRGADRTAVEALCDRLGFKSLRERIKIWR